MSSLDTSVLVRWLVRDDVAQTSSVERLFAMASRANRPFFVPTTVTLELEWVLRSRYRFDPEAFVSAIDALLETPVLEFEAEAALEQALDLYRSGRADFADCYHAGVSAAAGRGPLLTFDDEAAQLPGLRHVTEFR